jgi:uncharacterized protein (DUF169 family)
MREQHSDQEFAAMQETLMGELRLVHQPVAITYFLDQEALDRFRSRVPHYTPVKPLTFCQAEIGARMEGIAVLVEPDKLGCSNARYVFGWKGLDQGEIKGHLKYCTDLDQAARVVAGKPRLPEGAVLAVAAAPLALSPETPDVVHFVCDTMQAYHLLGDWMAVKDVHPFRPSLGVNSAACGGNVFARNEGQANLFLACSGSYNSGKAERGEINVAIPGADLPAVVERLASRVRDTGGASITRVGQPFPGADICKNCPLIVFKKVEA